jgi:hypothetical protein
MNKILPHPTIHKKYCYILACLLVCPFSNQVTCLAAEIAIKPSERWNNYFSGQDYVFNYGIVSDMGFDGAIEWRISAEERTILRGENPIQVQPGSDNHFEIKVSLPPVKPGVIRPVDIDVALFMNRSQAVIGHSRRRIWLFHKNPFKGRLSAFKRLNLYLFDPLKETARIFQLNEIPFHPVKRLSDLTELRNVLLIVGEGLSLQQFHGLADILKESASVGNRVVCLALANGQLPITHNEQDTILYSAMIFRGREVVKLLDKRLDGGFWPPDGKVIDSRIRLEGQRGRVAGRVVQQGQGWPWVELDFFKSKGKLLITGFSIVAKWDATPTPRYLFRSLVQYAGEVQLGKNFVSAP